MSPARPFTNSRFRVEIDGMAGSGAYEVVLPQGRLATSPSPRGRSNVEYATLTLRRGLTRSSDWYAWWHAAREGKRAPERTVLIVLLDESGADAVRWVCTGTQPVGYAVSGLHALGSEAVVETLDLSVTGFEATFDDAPVRNKPRAARRRPA